MNSFKQGISSPPPGPPKKSVQFWAFQLNLRFCLKISRRTDPHSRMSDMCKKTTLRGSFEFTIVYRGVGADFEKPKIYFRQQRPDNPPPPWKSVS